MLTIKNITKWQVWTLVALGLLVFALDGAVSASEADKRARLSEARSKLKVKEREFNEAYLGWTKNFEAAMRYHAKAVVHKKPELAKELEQRIDYAAGRMRHFGQLLAKAQYVIQVIEEHLAILDKTQRERGLVHDINGQLSDKGLWNSSSERSSFDTGKSMRLVDGKGNGY